MAARFMNYWKIMLGIAAGGFLAYFALYSKPKAPEIDDPERLLRNTELAMIELHARNRERVVQALHGKNLLQAMVDQEEKKIAGLQAEAKGYGETGCHGLQAGAISDIECCSAELLKMKISLQSAVHAVERMKQSIFQEEIRIRAKKAEAIALKVQLNETQFDSSIAMLKNLREN